MKKKYILIVAFVAALLSPLYFFIPNNIIISKYVYVENNLHALQRVLADSNEWHKWWPSTEGKQAAIFALGSNNYSIFEKTGSSIFIGIKNNTGQATTSLTIIPEKADSIKLQWDAAIPTSYNPVTRLRIYMASNSIKNNIVLLLQNIKSFYSTTANLYNLDIHRDIVKNSSLISTYDSSQGFPSTEKIYSLVGQLRKYITSQNAAAIDSPMLNIYTKDNLEYITKVALATDKKLVSNGKIQYRWMLAGGNILSAEVKGQQKKADSALAIVETYVKDYELLAPAIPFYSLITNRLAEKDSTKWVTKIYYPVMYYK